MNLREFKDSRFASSPHLLLIGNPVSHSLSPAMHNIAVKYHGLSLRYIAVQVDADEFRLLSSHMNQDNFTGANVTIPYKQQMLGYMDDAAEQCKKIGALNTIVKRDGILTGHNTDIWGFIRPLNSRQSDLKNKRAIVFGTGGASRAVFYGLKSLDMDDIVLVSRNPAFKSKNTWYPDARIISYDQWQSYADEAALFVNTTPLGMVPDIGQSPVKKSEKGFLAGKICYDIVYTPLKTTFLRVAEEAGATTINGLEMFIQQGNRSFELWTGEMFPTNLIREELMKRLS